MEPSQRIRYRQAQKQVKRIKGFYIHLAVYLMVNALIIFDNVSDGAELFDFENLSVLLCWGIGLLIHGLSVFSSNFFLGKDWEERKIREIMRKNLEEKS